MAGRFLSALFVSFLRAAVSADLSLHRYFLDPHFDASTALSLAHDIPVEELDIPILNRRPLTHHAFNLYLSSGDVSERRKLIEIIKVLVLRGSDVNAHYEDEPDLIFKAIMLREMDLAKEIAKAGAMLNSPLIFQQLYSLPCDPIPLSKMLLHGQTILAKRGSEIKLEALVKFFSGASLGIGAKPAVGSAELSSMSLRFNSSILSSIIDRNFEADISLRDVLQSLSEVSSSVHRTLLGHLLAIQESDQDSMPFDFIAGSVPPLLCLLTPP
jgi:hypothetical protein